MAASIPRQLGNSIPGLATDCIPFYAFANYSCANNFVSDLPIRICLFCDRIGEKEDEDDEGTQTE